MAKTRTLTIDRRRWLRGTTHKNSALYKSDVKKFCCVGIYCTNLLKLKKEDITEILALHDYELKRRRKDIKDFGPLESLDIIKIREEFYGPNDSDSLTDEEREAILKENFAKYGIKVRFVN